MPKAITFRLDTETSRALDVLTRGGASQSAAIRHAIIEAAMRAERSLAAKRVILQTRLGGPDGIDIAQLIAHGGEDER